MGEVDPVLAALDPQKPPAGPHAAMDASRSGVLVVDEMGNIALISAALERQFGFDSHELLGQPVGRLLPEFVRPAGLAQGLEEAGCELFGRRKDGTEIPVEIDLNLLPSPKGQFLILSVVDISERRHYEELQRQARERLEFEQLIAGLSAMFVRLEEDRVDEAIMYAQRRICEMLDLDRSSLFRFFRGDKGFVLTHNWSRFDERPFRLGVPVAEQFPWTVSQIRRGLQATFSSVDEIPDPIERESNRYYGTKSRAAIPLSIGGRTAGIIAFASTRHPRTWPEETIGRLQLIAQVFANVLARQQATAMVREGIEEVKRSQNELRNSYERIRDLSRRLLVAQEAERARISRELHDDIAQQTALLVMDIELLKGRGRGLEPEAQVDAARALDRAQELSKALHAMSHNLHPAKLQWIGLAAAVNGLHLELSKRDIPITYTHRGVPASLPADVALCMYRIAQEALHNAVKHSGARGVSMELIGSADRLSLSVQDDGVGFAVDDAWRKGLGLMSMRERLEAFGGTLKIGSQPSAGTRIEAVVPIETTEPRV